MKRFSVQFTVRGHVEYDDGQMVDMRQRAIAAGTDLATVVEADTRKAINRLPEMNYAFCKLLMVKTESKGHGFSASA